MSSTLENEVARRRTFAIISHPDAGKTTLTEKLLLYGGAIHLAGAVRAKAKQTHTTSDWMEIERQRGISISTSVLRFEYQGKQVNLLDTPGHKDFSEDTYRTLVAVDAAVMLIDAAKGVEPQTRKLFEVCRMRNLPIFTFINKLDRPGRDPLELIDELERVLGIRSAPVSWPIGMGQQFKGVYDREGKQLLVFQRPGEANVRKRIDALKISDIESVDWMGHLDLDSSQREELVSQHQELLSQLELLEIAGDPFDLERVLAGQLTPVFFGSAMNNFGVQHFLDNFLAFAPAPQVRKSTDATIQASDPRFSGFFFKIQANMDPQHRDRVAFLRVCSGKFEKGMEATHARLQKRFKLSKPLHFFAQERVLVEEAWPGDIVGLVDTTGDFRIGDTLSADGTIAYAGVPRFSPENFAGLGRFDPLKRKQLTKGLSQLAEEGVVQLFYLDRARESQPILGVVGALQFDVLQHRLMSEYNVDVRLERLGFIRARWPRGAEAVLEAKLPQFNGHADTALVSDRDGKPVILFKSDWSLAWAERTFGEIRFESTAAS